MNIRFRWPRGVRRVGDGSASGHESPTSHAVEGTLGAQPVIDDTSAGHLAHGRVGDPVVVDKWWVGTMCAWHTITAPGLRREWRLHMTESDEDLVVKAQAGDRGAWAQLCARHAPRLAAYLGGRLRRPGIVDKLVADVLSGAWKHLVDLQRPGDFPAWFRRVGGNLTLQWCRKHPEEPLGEAFPVERCGGDAEVHKRMDHLELALAQLNDAQRMALEQHIRGGMDIDALCEALHLDAPSVQALIEDALFSLDRLLGSSGT